MKLYTEEQLRASYNDGVENGYDGYGREYEDQFINSLTPIELPSDEEIFNESIKIMEEWYGSGCKEEIDAHFRGAKYVIDKIKKQQQ